MRIEVLLATGCLMLATLAAVGCGDDLPLPRSISIDTAIATTGWSPTVEFDVPDGTRSITIVADGDPDALYALGELTFADRIDRVAIDQGSAPGPAMRQSYDVEQIGQMAGDLFQTIRLGTFTQIYPYRPDQRLIAGHARLRIVSDKPGPVRVRVLMPEDDGGRRLTFNLVLVSDVLPSPDTDAFRSELTRIYAQAGIEITIGEVERVSGSPLARITQSSEPQESPTSQSAMLPALVAARDRPGLDLFFVESLPAGIAGLSLGTPGPPLRGSYYFGVVVRPIVSDVGRARVVAHETAHFLALQHVENVGVSGTAYPDPLDDTTPGSDNLMTSGTALTPDQAFALSRSAVLEMP